MTAITGIESIIPEKVVGKELLLKKSVKTYSYPHGKLVGTLPTGIIIVPYSFLAPKPPTQPNLWWQMDFEGGGSYYVEHRHNIFDLERLKEQFSPEEQELYFPKPDLPNWLGLAAVAVGLFQASRARNADERLGYRLIAVAGGWFYLRETISEFWAGLDLNPFDGKKLPG